MDLAPTLCELGGAEALPTADGLTRAGRMVRRGRWKLVVYAGLQEHDRLYDLAADPHETDDRSAAEPAICDELRSIALAAWNPVDVATTHDEKRANQRLVTRWWTEYHPVEDERWRPPARIPSEFTPL